MKSGLKTASLEQERNGHLLYEMIPLYCNYVASFETQYNGIHTNHIFRISFLHWYFTMCELVLTNIMNSLKTSCSYLKGVNRTIFLFSRYCTYLIETSRYHVNERHKTLQTTRSWYQLTINDDSQVCRNWAAR